MQVPDFELWRALDLVHLRNAVAGLPGGLDAAVSPGGSNFSLGQKQLVCMSTVLLCAFTRMRVYVCVHVCVCVRMCVCILEKNGFDNGRI
jgi:ABC-type transport system involved in Fe-S cluster assembly fused permease/ATPase subunit